VRSRLRWRYLAGAGDGLLGLAAAGLVAVAALGLWSTGWPWPMTPAQPVPGGHGWAAENHDAQGTLWVDVVGPRQPVVAWEFAQTAGLAGGPAVAADGTVYVASRDKRLHALSPQGEVRWTLPLPARPIGAPALGASGRIYIADADGGLAAVAANGLLVWSISGGDAGGLSGPITGRDETIYYTALDSLVAVTADGAVRWRAPLPTLSYISPLPRLSADGRYLFFADCVLDARTGELIFGPTPESFDVHLTGANGRGYVQSGLSFTEWWPGVTGEPVTLTPDERRAVREQYPFALQAGVTPDGQAWVQFVGNDSNNLAWVRPGQAAWARMGRVYREPGHTHPARVVAVDGEGTVFTCNPNYYLPRSWATCYAVPQGEIEPAWQLELRPEMVAVIGGALTPDGLYLATVNGALLAVRDRDRP
jgi:hypothetical protein